MEMKTLADKILLDFDPKGRPGMALIRESINESIDELNLETNLQRALITISATGTSDSYNVDDIDVNVDTIDVNVDEMGLFKEGFKYDQTNFILTIPESIKKIDDIYIDDIKQVPMSYSRMLNSYTEEDDWILINYGVHYGANANGYTCFGNEIHFNYDISSGVVQMVVYKEYDQVSDKDVIAAPTYFKQYLISNSIIILASRPNMIISQFALKRHMRKVSKALLGLKQRIINVEHKPGLDIW